MLLAGLVLACWVAVLAVVGATPPDAVGRISSIGIGEGTGFAIAWAAFAIVGTIIIVRRPGNAIGWLCLLGGMQVGLYALLTAFAAWSLATQPGASVGVVSAWLSHTFVSSLMVSPLLIMMRFPTGKPLGPGWRRAEQTALVLIAAVIVAIAVEPMPLFSFPGTPNPFAVGGPRLMAFGPGIVVALWLFPISTSVGALVVRYRRGSALQRVQIRWLAAASVVVGVAALSLPLTSPELAQGRMSTATAVAFALAFATIPVAIGIAIVRHQLYDIDRLVKRTLVYALVSGVLALVYVVTVLGLSAPLTVLLPTAGDTLTTAASTLLVAALFRPVRTRAQAAVDRRFDRERHEATSTVEAFSGTIRAEVELDSIVGQLLAGAGRVVHPSSSGCWLRARGLPERALVGSPGGR